MAVDDPDVDPFDPETESNDVANLRKHEEDREKAARVLIETRLGAYKRVFFEGTPSRDDRKIVLDDIAAFCRYNQSAFRDSDRLTNLLLGRQEVALRIHDHLRMTVDEMLVEYANIGT